MVTVTLIESLRELELSANYYYKDRLKALPNAKYNADNKTWRIPVNSLFFLEREFQGELFFQTPRWYITNEAPPDYKKLYSLSTNIDVPEMRLKPFDYQGYGIKWLVDRTVNDGFCILSDGVGLGKTVQAIGAMKWWIENKQVKKILLIVKKSVKTQWANEIEKFTNLLDTFQVAVTGDTPKKRKQAYDIAKDGENVILITSFHNFLSDRDYIGLIGFDFICIDEVHQICGRTTKMNNYIASICQYKPCIMLTGTPLMSQPENLFGIAQIANPKYLGSYQEFKNKYIVEQPSQFARGMETIGFKNLDDLRDKIQRIVLRRTEKEVSVSLPEVMIQQINCTQDTTQENISEAIKAFSLNYQSEISGYKTKPILTQKETEKLEQLEASSKGLIAARQAVATDPRLFHVTSSNFMKKNFGALVDISKYKMSDKIEKLLDLVNEIVSSGSKVIIFTKFWTAAHLASQDIEKNLKIPVLMYTGRENSQELRDYTVKRFTQTTQFNVLIGTEALSEGVNLAEARYVINLDQPDTFAIKTQRIGRVRRVSSKFNNVTVYDLITENSKDVDSLNNILKNIKLTDALINVTEAQSKALIEAMKGM